MTMDFNELILANEAPAMLPGIECGSMKALAGWVKESNHVMVF
jgi:hypothetical protein